MYRAQAEHRTDTSRIEVALVSRQRSMQHLGRPIIERRVTRARWLVESIGRRRDQRYKGGRQCQLPKSSHQNGPEGTLTITALFMLLQMPRYDPSFHRMPWTSPECCTSCLSRWAFQSPLLILPFSKNSNIRSAFLEYSMGSILRRFCRSSHPTLRNLLTDWVRQ